MLPLVIAELRSNRVIVWNAFSVKEQASQLLAHVERARQYRLLAPQDNLAKERLEVQSRSMRIYSLQDGRLAGVVWTKQEIYSPEIAELKLLEPSEFLQRDR